MRVDQQIGLENSPEEYIAKMVEVFREVRRVLRSDGTCWINIGDSFWGGKGQSGSGGKEYQQMRSEQGVSFSSPEAHVGGPGKTRPQDGKHSTIKPKDMVGIPWMLAFALRADGWWLRSEIIWHKSACMPESVSDRPTKSHEQVFLLTKSPTYYYDAEAIKERQKESTIERARYGWNGRTDDGSNGARTGSTFKHTAESGDLIGTIPLDGRRNKRTVWTIGPEPVSFAHFACFPQALVKPCILAGTSEAGCCPKCAAPWRRLLEHTTAVDPSARGSRFDTGKTFGYHNGRMKQGERFLCRSIGWEPGCKCNAGPPIPSTVLDCFAGAATVGVVCLKTGRNFIGIELSSDYIQNIAIPRLDEVASRVIPSLPFEYQQ